MNNAKGLSLKNAKGFSPNSAKGFSLNSAKGFTLIEVLIAVALAAVLAAMAFQGFSVASDSSEQVQEVSQRFDDLDRTFEMLARDMDHLVLRQDNNENGLAKEPLVVQPTEGLFLQLTRAGKPNPLGLMRSDLSRVRYRWTEGKVFRMNRHFYSLQEEVSELMLLDGVSSVVAEVLVSNATSVEAGPWTAVWPATNASSGGYPVAMRIRLELEDFGEVARIFELPSAEPINAGGGGSGNNSGGQNSERGGGRDSGANGPATKSRGGDNRATQSRATGAGATKSREI